MTTTTPSPEPDDIETGLAQLEQYVAGQAPTTPPSADVEPEAGGMTRRVRALHAQVAEAHRLAELQDDDTPLLIDTPKVRKRRLKAAEAARLHELAQNPMMRAWRAARMRRLLTALAVVSLAIALGWSTAGVQEFAAEGADSGSPRWWFAWAVEPFISLALLFVVGSRAYLATQGRPLNDAVLKRIEYLFLGLSLGMNAWPYTPWAAEEFVFSRLVLHILGPIVAVALVMALPIVLKGFDDLDHHRHAPGGTGGGTGPEYRHNAPAPHTGQQAQYTPEKADIAALVARARQLIAQGVIPANAGVHKLRPHLGCGTDVARQVRDALRDEAG